MEQQVYARVSAVSIPCCAALGAEASSARTHAAAPARGKSLYDNVDMLGVQPSALLAAELAEREKEATLDETCMSVLDELLGQDVCIAVALAFVGREKSWLHRQRTSRGDQGVDATGATSGEAIVKLESHI